MAVCFVTSRVGYVSNLWSKFMIDRSNCGIAFNIQRHAFSFHNKQTFHQRMVTRYLCLVSRSVTSHQVKHHLSFIRREITALSSCIIQAMAASTTSIPPFTSRVNATTGKLEWVVEDENYDFIQEIARSAYTDMLHDDERNKKYLAGIQKAISSVHTRGQQAHVLDIGTGTGLLAMMAAQCGADTVHACEAFEPIGKAAQQIVAKNGFKEKIKVIMKRSTEVSCGPDGDIPRRANILPAEVFDTELIGEGAIPTYLHAHKHLLTDDCICVPHAATIYAQVVQSTHVEAFHKLHPIRMTDCDDIIPHESMTDCSGAASVYDLQLSQLSPDNFQPITEPLKMFTFNFSKGDFETKGQNQVRTTSLISGECHCVFMWWELDMDPEGEVKLSTAPVWAHPDGNKAPWRDHWMQAVYFLQKPVETEKGQAINVTLTHDDYSLWFTVNSTTEEGPIERPICQCGAHVVWSRPRIGMLNDSARNVKYISALKKVISPRSTCVSISDGSLLPLMAARLGANKVYSLEPNSLSRRVMQGLLKTNQLEQTVSLIPHSAQELPSSIFNSQVDVLIAEPFFISSLLPWHSLYFWYCRSALAPHLSDDAVILPRGASLRAIAVEFDHLWKFHAPVGDLEGFDVRIFDDLTQKAIKDSDAKEEPHHLWEYPGRPLTADFNIMEFNFMETVPSDPIEVVGEVPFIGSGTCHGVAIWMDFKLDENISVTTGLQNTVTEKSDILDWCRNWKQGVHFLKHNPEIKDGCIQKLKYKASFKPESGNLFFEFEVTER